MSNASIANKAVDFAYVLQGGLPLINYPEVIYFVAEKGELYIGNSLIANRVSPEDIVRTINDAGYSLRSFVVQGEGNVITDIQLDEEGKLVATRGNVNTRVYLGSDSTTTEETQFGGSFQVLQNIGITADGAGITRRFVNVKLPNLAVDANGDIIIDDTNTWWKLSGLTVTQNGNKTLSISVDLLDQDGHTTTETFNTNELDFVTKSELDSVKTLAQTAKDTADAAKTAAEEAKSAVEEIQDTLGDGSFTTEDQVRAIVNTAISTHDAEASSAKSWLGESSTVITDGGTQLPTITGKSYGSTSDLPEGGVVAYGDAEFIWDGVKWREYGSKGDVVLKTQQVIAGGGLTGGGALNGNVTISHEEKSVKNVAGTDLEAITKVVTDKFGHVTEVEKTDLYDTIKDAVGELPSALEPGDGIKIENGVISVDIEDVDTYTKDEIDTKITSAAAGVDLSPYATKTEVNTALGGKQDTLTPGTGISIADGVISATTDLTPFARSADVTTALEDKQDKLTPGTGISIAKNEEGKTVISTDKTYAEAADLQNLATSVQQTYATKTDVSTDIATAKSDAVSEAVSSATSTSEQYTDTQLADYYTKSETYTKDEIDELTQLPIASQSDVEGMLEEVFKQA